MQTSPEEKTQRHINLTMFFLLWKKDQSKTLIVFLNDNAVSPSTDFLEVEDYSSDDNVKACVMHA